MARRAGSQPQPSGCSGSVAGQDWCRALRAVIAAAALAPTGAAGQVPVLLQSAQLLDGTDGQPVRAADILIRDGVVARIAAPGSVDPLPGALVFDAAGKTVVPGMINARGLVGLVRSPERPPDHFSRGTILGQLGIHASYGVTTTASLAPEGTPLRNIAEAIDAGAVRHAARVVTPLRAVCREGGRGRTSPELTSLYETVGSARQARSAVDALQGSGAQLIEVQADRRGPCAEAGLELLTAIVARAVRRGLLVSVVTSRADAALAAVRAGARFIAASVRDRELGAGAVDELREAGVVYAPALAEESALFAFADRPAWIDDRYLRRSLAPGISGQLRGPVRVRQALDPDHALKRRRFDVARRNLRSLAGGGVRIAMASGSGFPHSFEGYSEYREAVLLKRAGLTEAQVVSAFSVGSAAALGLESQRGAVELGHVADLMILNSSPLETIHSLRDLHAVLVGGQLVNL